MLGQVLKRYHEKHRFYHNFNHIKTMLEEADRYDVELSEEQYLAILFHDVIYNPHSTTNEEDSCDVFNDYVFGLKAVSFDAKLVRQIIMDTKYPFISTCKESQIIHDLDFLSFGRTEEQYKRDIKLLEWEYTYPNNTQKMINDFYHKRLAFLKGLQERQIYYTKTFKHLENRAKFNICEDIDLLEVYNESV